MSTREIQLTTPTFIGQFVNSNLYNQKLLDKKPEKSRGPKKHKYSCLSLQSFDKKKHSSIVDYSGGNTFDAIEKMSELHCA